MVLWQALCIVDFLYQVKDRSLVREGHSLFGLPLAAYLGLDHKNPIKCLYRGNPDEALIIIPVQALHVFYF